ncbi:TPA: LPXTG cell wall anchor domain-containing protein [Streptococcus equi subsp. zooepidemicus]|uniref:LPXTG cell wall anchor domain-containing protein n=1 Tax=Streptococcus equi TaxID=1336 RepID=UPI0013F5E22B|nr:LPXTG cell wall anchor domain-containing protein [Streptococcus equi]HEL0028042.1 LPXTG cell wall anchor domain-containing protein [Streptococcus equi subsp. zooepidemicus]HEL0669458.1 LPXTG cell wall anchor domain-containing protein [Streptococcus equi subsp. zooepidemicus]HEL0822537.1 LPXTG cell wall anchor domain-containing protein [Streptococcus equi subsp. zooepidemicus]HEL1304220.1 LPXTG cell wall anchor domain-containing protein [Streptococcus equi subsp. zooepidemicus]HEL1318114.1 L
MKSCKSTLRKAVMAAMLAGAITTTGGVKAEESLSLTTLLKEYGQTFQGYDAIANEVSRMRLIDIERFDFSDLARQLDNKLEADVLMPLVVGLVRQVEVKEILEQEKEQMQRNLDEVSKNSEDLANKLLAAQAEADRLSQAVDSLGRLTNSAKRELTEKLAEIDQLTADKVKAETDLETANTTITSLQEELAGAKASYDKLSEEKAAADQALAEANARVSELEQQAASANARVADLEVQLAAKTAELDVVKADKAELEAKVKELQDMLQQKDRSNADLQANIERLKQELADKFKDQAQPRSKTPQASNSAAKQKASKPTAKPAGQLPSTGEATANPFFTAAAVAIMTGAGLVTVMPKRQKN